jgi:hypothetical protein
VLARVPLDVDLEDKLVYGLTPIRLAYAAVAMVSAFAVWSAAWAPSLMRGSLAVAVIVGGVTVSWGRWRGRAIDLWVADILVYASRNYRIWWRAGWRPWRLAA